MIKPMEAVRIRIKMEQNMKVSGCTTPKRVMVSRRGQMEQSILDLMYKVRSKDMESLSGPKDHLLKETSSTTT